MSGANGEFDILGIGVATVDDLYQVEKFPERNDKFPVLGIVRQGGGLAATALVAASRLGCRCHFILPLDKDEHSCFIRNTLTREGVVLHERLPEPGEHAFYSIVITERESGARAIMWDAKKVFSLHINPADLDLVAQASCLMVDNIYAAAIIDLVGKARAAAKPVVGDFETTDAAAATLSRLADHLILPLNAAAKLTGETQPGAMVTALLREPGRSLACVTDSERGCWFAHSGLPNQVEHQPAFKIPNVVDTCGCGDVFHGAYAASLVKGFSPRERILRSSAAAAVKAGKTGAQLGAPSEAELEAFLRSNL